MLPATVPTFMQPRILRVEDSKIMLGSKVVDPDAGAIIAMMDRGINQYISNFSDTYVLDVTAHCNMSCRYCYYKVDNSVPHRKMADIVAAAEASGYKNICLMGAEPTTREDLPDLIRAVKTVVPTVGITTNGKKLEDAEYLADLRSAGLDYLNYSMHFTDSYKLGKKKAAVVKNILDAKVQVVQLAFTVSSIDEMLATYNVIDVLIDLGLEPKQFVIRAGAGIGACKLDSGLFMSDMIKAAIRRGCSKMAQGGSNVYFAEFFYRGHNVHVVRWPTNELAANHSYTGPVFETPLGGMKSPVFQLISALSPAQIEHERSLLVHPLGTRTLRYAVERGFGKLEAVEWSKVPGKLFLHCDIRQWGVAQARECRKIWAEFQTMLLGEGHREIFSCIPKDDKIRKWQLMFGMSLSKDNVDYELYHKELGHGY